MRGATNVGARELKTRLGRYLNRVRRGETIVVTDRSEPVAELRPIGVGQDPMAAALARLAATGGLTLPTRKGLVRIGAARLTGGCVNGSSTSTITPAGGRGGMFQRVRPRACGRGSMRAP